MMLYTIVDKSALDTVLPEQVKQYTGYDKDYTLRESAFIVRELENGYWLVSCKLCNYKYVANKCVEEEMSDTEIAMAEMFYGKDNLLTEEDIQTLVYKDILV